MKRTRRNAFTLAEMLVVIAIILILAALLVPAVYLGLVAAQNAAIAVELGQLDAAMKQYKVLYKNYPPNFNDASKVNAHIKQAFGRSNITAPTGYDPGEALVFWLKGYTTNPIDPLTESATVKRVPLMQFDPTRLKPGPHPGGEYYYPANGQEQPYVYIHSGVNGNGYSTTSYTAVSPGKGTAVAYKSSKGAWMNDDSFQIISAGLDGDYGTNAVGSPPVFPTATGGNKDNLTNFSGGTLASQVK